MKWQGCIYLFLFHGEFVMIQNRCIIFILWSIAAKWQILNVF